MNPHVTVVIATYNYCEVLPYAIRSVLSQRYTDFELLVIGDACTDDSEEVVGRIEDPRLQWINRRERTGHQSGPNNEGLRRARGEIVAYLSHDDLWFPNHLEHLVAALDAGADFAYAMAFRVKPGKRSAIAPRVPIDAVAAVAPSLVAHWKQPAIDAGCWRLPEDGRRFLGRDLWRRMLRRGARGVFVPRVSVVKLSASKRSDVYVARPSHEQAHWLARIQSEPDLALQLLCDPEVKFPERGARLRAALRALAERPSVGGARRVIGLAARLARSWQRKLGRKRPLEAGSEPERREARSPPHS